ncbi:MAG: hypothetical protein ACOYXR_10005 [Nitrospirota bacterium]
MSKILHVYGYSLQGMMGPNVLLTGAALNVASGCSKPMLDPTD